MADLFRTELSPSERINDEAAFLFGVCGSGGVLLNPLLNYSVFVRKDTSSARSDLSYLVRCGEPTASALSGLLRSRLTGAG